MKNINFNVSKDTIEKLSEDIIISDSFNYVQLNFKFDSSWNQYNVKKASFFSDYDDGEEKYEVDIVNDMCIIPFEILKKTKFKNSFFVGVYGQIIENDTLKQRNTTNIIAFSLRQGAYFTNALNPGEIEPSAYDLYLSKMQEIFETELNKYNNNAKEKIEEYNTLTDNEIDYFNSNATTKMNEFNSNAEEKREEINQIANSVSADKIAVEEMKSSVETSEHNAKIYETNAKASEQNAQNSANKASESESNITSIEKNIIQIQTEVQANKEATDTNLEATNTNVTEATKQAETAKEQAQISTENAAQTSSDLTEVTQIKSAISDMKTSIENTKTEVESARDDTLEAKEIVENSLENERIVSDKKYARAIESDLITINEFGQVELDEDGYMKEVSVDSNLDEITQETREGYNLVKPLTKEVTLKGVTLTPTEKGSIRLLGTSTDGLIISLADSNNFPVLEGGKSYTRKVIVDGTIDTIISDTDSVTVLITGRNTNTDNIMGDLGISSNGIFKKTTELESTQTMNFSLYVSKAGATFDCEIFFECYEGTDDKPFEQYGASPSLDYPSDFKNLKKNIEIFNFTNDNIFDIKNCEKINGYYNDSGVFVSDTSNISFIKILLPKEKVTISSNYTISKIMGFKNDDYSSGDVLSSSNKIHTIENDGSYKYFGFYTSVSSYNSADFYLMINRGENALPYVPFEKGFVEKITLSDNQFLGKFKGYKNYINNGKIKGYLRERVLTGNEEWKWNFYSENVPQFYTRLEDALPKFTNDILCNYLKVYINNNADVVFINPLNANSTLDEWKNTLKELYEAGKPLKILYILAEEIEEEPSTENQKILNSLQVYNGINNISADDCTLNFKANKSIVNYIDEKLNEERKISDSKYARALKTQVEDTNFAQIYAESPETENLKIKGVELSQDTREGYNKLNVTMKNSTKNGIDGINNGDGSVTIKGTSTEATSNTSFDLGTIELKAGEPISVKAIGTESIDSSVGMLTLVEAGVITLISFATKKFYAYTPVEDIIGTFRFYVKPTQTIDATIKVLVVDGIKTEEEMPEYEQYGASPSLDYPSEVEVLNKQNLSIYRNNILDTTNIDKSIIGVAQKTKDDGGIAVNGTPTSTWYSLKQQTFNTPIKAGTKIFLDYGKTDKLERDNTFSPFLWLFNKNGTLFRTLNRTTINNGYYEVEQDIYSITLGFEGFKIGNTYDEDIYIELEISNKKPTHFHKYEATDINIPIKNLVIGEYFDVINRENKSQDKIVQELVFTGDENWFKSESNDITQSFQLILNYSVEDYFGLCNYLRTGVSGEVEKFSPLGTNLYIAVNKTRASTVDEFKALLAQLYQSGKPMKFYLIRKSAIQETLPDEVKKELDKFELYDGLNNVLIDNGTFSFTYNKSLSRAFEEVLTELAELKALHSTSESEVSN